MDTLDVEIFLALSFIVSVMESDLLSCRGIFDKKTRSNALGRSLCLVVTSTSSNVIFGNHRWPTSESHLLLCDIWDTRSDSRSGTSTSLAVREVARLNFSPSMSAILMSDHKGSFIKIVPINYHSSFLITILKVIMIFISFYFTSFKIENINLAMELLMNLS